jgi:FAD synthetase
MKVLVFGTFDEMHPGHEFFLNEAKKYGDLYVVVARDKSVEMIKKRRPVQDEHDRLRILVQKMPDAVVVLGSASGDFLDPVWEISPDLILLGYDQNLPPGIQESDFPCPFDRLKPFWPDRYKSSLRRT